MQLVNVGDGALDDALELLGVGGQRRLCLAMRNKQAVAHAAHRAQHLPRKERRRRKKDLSNETGISGQSFFFLFSLFFFALNLFPTWLRVLRSLR